MNKFNKNKINLTNKNKKVSISMTILSKYLASTNIRLDSFLWTGNIIFAYRSMNVLFSKYGTHKLMTFQRTQPTSPK